MQRTYQLCGCLLSLIFALTGCGFLDRNIGVPTEITPATLATLQPPGDDNNEQAPDELVGIPSVVPTAPTTEESGADQAVDLVELDEEQIAAFLDLIEEHDDLPYDALFIDAITTHHLAAIDLANQALAEARSPRIKQLAEQVILTRQRTVAQMQQLRREWYPDVPATPAIQLATGLPQQIQPTDDTDAFETQFIDVLRDYQRQVIALARHAGQNAEQEQLRGVAEQIEADQVAILLDL